jgi:peptide deformylase
MGFPNMNIIKIVQLNKDNFDNKTISLRIPCKEIDDFGESFQNIVNSLIDCFKTYDVAVGLAAPQVGLNIKLTVINLSKDKSEPTLIIINPKIISVSGKKDKKKEACMSVPGYRGEVERRNKIVIQYQDRKGDFQELIAEGYLARVIAHEIDHLEGILYIDRMTSLTDLETSDLVKKED